MTIDDVIIHRKNSFDRDPSKTKISLDTKNGSVKMVYKKDVKSEDGISTFTF
jgi:hypothetical protein